MNENKEHYLILNFPEGVSLDEAAKTLRESGLKPHPYPESGKPEIEWGEHELSLFTFPIVETNSLDEMIDKIRNYSEMKGSLLVKLSRDAQVPGTEIFTSLSGIYTHLFAMRKDEIQTLDLSDAAFYDSREHY